LSFSSIGEEGFGGIDSLSSLVAHLLEFSNQGFNEIIGTGLVKRLGFVVGSLGSLSILELLLCFLVSFFIIVLGDNRVNILSHFILHVLHDLLVHDIVDGSDCVRDGNGFSS